MNKRLLVIFGLLILGLLFATTQLVPDQHEITVNSSSPVPHGTSVTFSGAQSYEWDVDGDGNIEHRGEAVTFSYDEPANYSMRVFYNNQSKIVPITATNTPPSVELSQSPTINTSQRLFVNAEEVTDGNGDNVSYEWDTDSDGTFDVNGVNTSISFNTTGEHRVRLRATDEHGASNTGELIVTVEEA